VCVCRYDVVDDVVVMIARLEALFYFYRGRDRSVDRMTRLAYLVLHKLAILAQHVSHTGYATLEVN